jgi:hypothetical protein
MAAAIGGVTRMLKEARAEKVRIRTDYHREYARRTRGAARRIPTLEAEIARLRRDLAALQTERRARAYEPMETVAD